MTLQDFIKINARVRGSQTLHDNAKVVFGKFGSMAEVVMRRRIETEMSKEDADFYRDALDSCVEYYKLGSNDKTFGAGYRSLGNGGYMKKELMGSKN